MIFLHVHSQQIYSFFRHLSASSVPRIITGVLICGMMAGCAANREKEDEVKYDMMENLTARFNIVNHGRKIIADVKLRHLQAHRDKYQQRSEEHTYELQYLMRTSNEVLLLKNKK